MKSMSPRPSFFQTYGPWLREAFMWGFSLFMFDIIQANFQRETLSLYGMIRDLVYSMMAGFIFASIASDTFNRKLIG